MNDNYLLKNNDLFPLYIKTIKENLENDQGISSDLIEGFIKIFAETLAQRQEMPEEFIRLTNKVISEPEFRKDRFIISPEIVKEMIYSFYCLTRFLREKEEEQIREKELKNPNSETSVNFRHVLEIIGLGKRIRHKELAEQYGESSSVLSQLLRKYEHDGYFTSYKPGREKIYELTKKGKIILQEYKKKETGKTADIVDTESVSVL